MRTKRALVSLGVLGFWVAVWAAGHLAVGSDLLLPAPWAVAVRLGQLAGTGAFWRVIACSFCRIMLGFLLGTLAGCGLGVCTAAVPALRRLMRLPMSLIKATPVASFVILALVWISGKNLSVFIGFLMVLPLMHANVEQGLLSTDPLLLEAAAAYRLNRRQKALAVYLPAVMPYFLSACRVALGFAWKAGIAGEVIAIPRDAIGTQLYNAKVYLETTDLFAWTLVIVVLSMVLEKALARLVGRAAERFGGAV